MKKEKINALERGLINGAVQHYPYLNAMLNPPKEHKRYLCLANVPKSMCFVEHVCLYDFERKCWLLNRKEVDVCAYMELPTVTGV